MVYHSHLDFRREEEDPKNKKNTPNNVSAVKPFSKKFPKKFPNIKDQKKNFKKILPKKKKK